jgi:hypothetical protein
MKLLAIDPGIDVAGAAIYDLDLIPRRPAGFRGATVELRDVVRGFVGVASGRTRAEDSDLVRCASLARWAASVIDEHHPTVVVLEVPAIAGAHRAVQARQTGRRGAINAAGLQKLERAIGAIGAAVLTHPRAPRLREFRADYPALFRDKRVRHDVINAALRSAGRAALKGNADERDAAFLGGWAIILEH